MKVKPPQRRPRAQTQGRPRSPHPMNFGVFCNGFTDSPLSDESP